jgi:hypothetical protein
MTADAWEGAAKGGGMVPEGPSRLDVAVALPDLSAA